MAYKVIFSPVRKSTKEGPKGHARRVCNDFSPFSSAGMPAVRAYAWYLVSWGMVLEYMYTVWTVYSRSNRGSLSSRVTSFHSPSQCGWEHMASVPPHHVRGHWQ